MGGPNMRQEGSSSKVGYQAPIFEVCFSWGCYLWVSAALTLWMVRTAAYMGLLSSPMERFSLQELATVFWYCIPHIGDVTELT